MDSEKREKLYKILKEIEDKYKSNNLLYKKIQEACRVFGSCYSVNPETYRELAKLTSKINYRCNFKDGKCKKTYRGMKCCCHSCVFYFGHFRERFFSVYHTIEYIEKEILYYVKKYNSKTGFWRKNKGCILPRERRSSTCLNFNCLEHRTNEELLLWSVLRERKYPHYIKEIIKILKDYFLYRVE